MLIRNWTQKHLFSKFSLVLDLISIMIIILIYIINLKRPNPATIQNQITNSFVIESKLKSQIS